MSKQIKGSRSHRPHPYRTPPPSPYTQTLIPCSRPPPAPLSPPLPSSFRLLPLLSFVVRCFSLVISIPSDGRNEGNFVGYLAENLNVQLHFNPLCLPPLSHLPPTFRFDLFDFTIAIKPSKVSINRAVGKTIDFDIPCAFLLLRAEWKDRMDKEPLGTRDRNAISNVGIAGISLTRPPSSQLYVELRAIDVNAGGGFLHHVLTKGPRKVNRVRKVSVRHSPRHYLNVQINKKYLLVLPPHMQDDWVVNGVWIENRRDINPRVIHPAGATVEEVKDQGVVVKGEKEEAMRKGFDRLRVDISDEEGEEEWTPNGPPSRASTVDSTPSWTTSSMGSPWSPSSPSFSPSSPSSPSSPFSSHSESACDIHHSIHDPFDLDSHAAPALEENPLNPPPCRMGSDFLDPDMTDPILHPFTAEANTINTSDEVQLHHTPLTHPNVVSDGDIPLSDFDVVEEDAQTPWFPFSPLRSPTPTPLEPMTGEMGRVEEEKNWAETTTATDGSPRHTGARSPMPVTEQTWDEWELELLGRLQQ